MWNRLRSSRGSVAKDWMVDFFALPAHSRVTSKFDPSGRKFNHYALVCFSDTPLLPLRNENKIAFIQLRNLRTGRPVGASQVTAVVQRVNEGRNKLPQCTM